MDPDKEQNSLKDTENGGEADPKVKLGEIILPNLLILA